MKKCSGRSLSCIICHLVSSNGKTLDKDSLDILSSKAIPGPLNHVPISADRCPNALEAWHRNSYGNTSHNVSAGWLGLRVDSKWLRTITPFCKYLLRIILFVCRKILMRKHGFALFWCPTRDNILDSHRLILPSSAFGVSHHLGGPDRIVLHYLRSLYD